MATKLIYELLEDVNKIEPVKERKEALRKLCMDNNQVAIALQYTYHPDIELVIPKGDGVPETLWTPSKHGQVGPTYKGLRTIKVLFKGAENNLPQMRKEQIFINIIENVDKKDAEIFIAIKDKVMPFDKLDEKFVKKALPELFPK